VHERMNFGMELAPAHCQNAMDQVVGRARVPRARSFFYDVTIPGLLAKWRELW
jgi:hypothetical protein